MRGSTSRWAMTCYFRRDGVPLWRRPELIAGPGTATVPREAPRTFIDTLARELQVDGHCVLPAYEDAFYYLWRERRLPVNVDPLDAKLEDPQLRARLAQTFEKGLEAVVGYVLPLAYDEKAAGEPHGDDRERGEDRREGTQPAGDVTDRAGQSGAVVDRLRLDALGHGSPPLALVARGPSSRLPVRIANNSFRKDSGS